MNKSNDKRIFSKEGFLLADAVLTKVGPLPYLRGELNMGGDPNGVVMIDRSRSVLEAALPSMIGAPLTINHPGEFIGSTDADSYVVGSVASIPEIDSQGRVKAKVRVFHQDAIDMIKSGDDELSPGFNFVMQNLDDDRGTADIAQMSINHVAIVPKGRAGNAVRILDSLPPNLYATSGSTTMESITMDDKQLNDVVAKAVDAAMKAQGDATQNTGAIKDAFASAITDSLKPMLDQVNEMKAAQDKAIQDAKDKEAADKAAKDKDEFAQSIIDGERARYKVLETAKRFIASDKHADLENADAKAIMVAAVGDSVEDAANKSEDYLRGILDGMVKAADTQATQSTDGVPAGVVKAGGEVKDRASMYRKRFEDRNKSKEAK